MLREGELLNLHWLSKERLKDPTTIDYMSYKLLEQLCEVIEKRNEQSLHGQYDYELYVVAKNNMVHAFSIDRSQERYLIHDSISKTANSPLAQLVYNYLISIMCMGSIEGKNILIVTKEPIDNATDKTTIEKWDSIRTVLYENIALMDVIFTKETPIKILDLTK